MLANTGTSQVVLQVSDWHCALGQVRHAMSDEETRYYLKGVYMHAKERDGERVLAFVATDGHRMAYAEVAAPANWIVPAALTSGIILPAAFVEAVYKATGRAKDGWKSAALSIEGTRVMFQCGAQTVDWAELVDGTFPDYQRVIPSGVPAHGRAILPGEAFKQALAALNGFNKGFDVAAGRGNRAIKFEFEGDKVILSAICGAGKATVMVSGVVWEGQADDYQRPPVGFNGAYLAEMVRAFDSRFVGFDYFDCGGPNRFDSVTGAKDFEIVMPMRV